MEFEAENEPVRDGRKEIERKEREGEEKGLRGGNPFVAGLKL